MACTRGCRGCASWRSRQHGLRSHRPLLVCFLASHVDGEGRKAALSRLLDSIDAQLDRRCEPALHVSWHATDPRLRPEIAAMLSGRRPWLRRQLAQQTSHSQFEHLAALVADCRTRSEAPAWVCFTDDDDLWSPQRFALLEEQCSGAAPRTRALICRRKARPVAAAGAAEPSNAADVLGLLGSGAAIVCDSAKVVLEPGKGEADEAFHRAEPFDYVVRFELLAEFCGLAPVKLLRHKLCDMGWTRWVRDNCGGGALRTFEPSDPEEWMYWYGQSLGEASASREVDVAPYERKLAARVNDRTLFATEGAAARFLAVLRNRLEQVLVPLRARLEPGTSGILPQQLLDSSCAAQVAHLVQVAASSWPADCLARLHQWLTEQARGPLSEWLLCALDFEATIELRTLDVQIVPGNSRGRSRDEILRGLERSGALPHGFTRECEIIPK